MLGWQAATASLSFLTATMIQGLVILNYPTYEPQRWHGTLMMFAVLAIALFVNTILVSRMAQIERLVLFIHLAGFLGVLVPQVFYSTHVPAGDVFGKFVNDGGWSSDGLAFCIGLITSVFAFLGTWCLSHLTKWSTIG